MPKQFENPQEQKVEDETVNKESPKRIDIIAEKAAEKASKTQQKNEKDQPIFSK